MTTTNATPAKLAVINRLKQEAASGRLAKVEVHYAWPGKVGLRCVYGGGWRFDQEDAVEEPGILVREVVAISLYVRVLRRPACPVEVTDAEADGIGGLIGKIFRADPRLAGPFTWLGVASGQGDYSRTEHETISIHAYQVRVGSHLQWS